jgi:DNA-binding NtrC family response regulator
MSKKRILIVDDEEQIRFCISIILKMKGYETICLSNGEEALHVIMRMHYTDQKIDLIICDNLIPKISGEELIDKSNAFKFNIPFLIISGFGERGMIVRLMSKGCRDFIDKPFEPFELEKKVEMILNEQNMALLGREKN